MKLKLLTENRWCDEILTTFLSGILLSILFYVFHIVFCFFYFSHRQCVKCAFVILLPLPVCRLLFLFLFIIKRIDPILLLLLKQFKFIKLR